MSEVPPVPGTTAARLAQGLVARTGARPDALRSGAVMRIARDLAPEDLDREGGLEAAVDLALGAAVVGETYLFRHPEQLRFAVAEAARAWQGSGRERLHAWSAGCATGEEAWSIAAILAREHAPERFAVLGTDIVPAHVEAARAGEYGAWSSRDVGPIEWAALEPGRAERRRVDPRLRASVRFEVHNLVGPPRASEERFDLVACRNVLLYMTAAAAQRALATLAAAVVPGGLLLLGPADLPPGVSIPDGLQPLGSSELLCWARRARPATAPRPRPSTRSPVAEPLPGRAPPAAAASDRRRAASEVRPALAAHVGAHVAALGAIERGDLEGAEAHLARALERAPDYASGQLERALLLTRLGRSGAAAAAARAALARVEGLADHAAVEGPAPCSAGHLRRNARALLGRLRGTST